MARRRVFARRFTTSTDPHSVSHTLDDITSASLIKRLESRGQTDVFRKTFAYLPSLLDSAHVLEVGCGTGVLCRALRSKGYGGRLTGVDQSPQFIRAAERLASSEDISFLTTDGASLDELKGQGVDVVLMHTLLSHVPEPRDVLEAARSLAEPGQTRLLVTDGDYLGLSFAYPDDPAFGLEMDRALREGVFVSPSVMRDLPWLLPATGWELTSHTSTSVTEVGADATYWLSFAEAYVPTIKASGRLPHEAVDRWWRAQQRYSCDGVFFAHATYLSYDAVATTIPAGQ